MRAKAPSIVVTGFVLFAAATVQGMEEKKLGFRHTASKELRLDCDNNADVQAAHTCYDRDGNETKITAGKEWELMSGSSAICTEEIKHHDVPKTMQFRIRTE